MRAHAIALAALLLLTACGASAPGVAPGAALPRNEGGNADRGGIHVRNAYVRGGALHAILINSGPAADRLEQVGAEAGNVGLNAPVELPPGALVGTDRPLGTATGLGAGTGSWARVGFRFREAGILSVELPMR
ncbi:hypothetical protein OIE66_11430 [Nonomuraea sp. NBC_01738]|uniref:hypothetical protein n=1 Tax=Nonomuraea sp. NBC_01738 TaxID=2976003 RepID=UPI002E11E353|nr:hypothetical protein OIE66_11430 [Nonomuraea sp. NBC_01738]